MQTVILEANKEENLIDNRLSSTNQLLKLSPDNFILMALKLSSDEELTMRCYEACGESAELTITSDLGLELDCTVDCLENASNIMIEKNHIINPFKITVWKLLKYEN